MKGHNCVGAGYIASTEDIIGDKRKDTEDEAAIALVYQRTLNVKSMKRKFFISKKVISGYDLEQQRPKTWL
jgi:hypothetical protein